MRKSLIFVPGALLLSSVLLSGCMAVPLVVGAYHVTKPESEKYIGMTEEQKMAARQEPGFFDRLQASVKKAFGN